MREKGREGEGEEDLLGDEELGECVLLAEGIVNSGLEALEGLLVGALLLRLVVPWQQGSGQAAATERRDGRGEEGGGGERERAGRLGKGRQSAAVQSRPISTTPLPLLLSSPFLPPVRLRAAAAASRPASASCSLPLRASTSLRRSAMMRRNWEMCWSMAMTFDVTWDVGGRERRR